MPLSCTIPGCNQQSRHYGAGNAGAVGGDEPSAVSSHSILVPNSRLIRSRISVPISTFPRSIVEIVSDTCPCALGAQPSCGTKSLSKFWRILGDPFLWLDECLSGQQPTDLPNSSQIVAGRGLPIAPNSSAIINILAIRDPRLAVRALRLVAVLALLRLPHPPHYAGGRVRAVCRARVAVLGFSGPSLGRVNLRSVVGSRYAPFHLTPICRCGPVTRPVCPESPSRSPFPSLFPAFTSIFDKCI
jgi:hypothetical protein